MPYLYHQLEGVPVPRLWVGRDHIKMAANERDSFWQGEGEKQKKGLVTGGILIAMVTGCTH